MIKFVHTNIITDNWKNLADFYIRVFDCIPLLPERNLKGKWLDRGVNLNDAHISGIHLKLPGYENDFPTLEIFQYDKNLDKPEAAANRKGFGHIAFRTDNVENIVQKIIANGGSLLGDIVETKIENAGHLTFVYAKDIDGNIIEIQNWK